jgi:hypothetical protein
MKQDKCAVCGQEVFDSLLSELKKKDSSIDKQATEILNNVITLIIKEMDKVFPKDEIQAFDELFEETKAFSNIRDMISMSLMPEKR